MHRRGIRVSGHITPDSNQVKNSRFCRGSVEDCNVVFLLRLLEEDELGTGGASWETPWTVSLMVSFERQKST